MKLNIEWEFTDMYDTGYGEVEGEFQVSATVLMDGLKAISATIDAIYVSWSYNGDTENFHEYDSGSLKQYTALEAEAMERAENSIDAEDLKQAKADAWIKHKQEES